MAKVTTAHYREFGDKYLDELLQLRWFWGTEDQGGFFQPTQDDGGYVTITYFFSDEGSGGRWTDDGSTSETANFKLALESWSNVAKIRFVEVSKEEDATWVEYKEAWDSNSNNGHTLSRHESPYDLGLGATQAKGQFNVAHDDWVDGGTGPGGAVYHAFVREIGHALGLDYSDDEWGNNIFGGDERILSGTELNSAMGAWAGSPLTSTHGSVGGPMAYDIQAIQSLYGIEENHNEGDTIYELKDRLEPSEPGGEAAHWEAIYDTGGNDTIAYLGERNAVIDLNAAKLTGGQTGGGAASYVEDILSGFTIAKHVDIENAHGGAGHDTLRGNHLDNSLYGGKGNDHLTVEDGTNTLIGGQGRDTFRGGRGNDTFIVDDDDAFIYGANIANPNTLIGGGGHDTIIIHDTTGAHVALAAGSSFATGAQSIQEVYGDIGDDVIDASALRDVSSVGFERSLFGGGGDDRIHGTTVGDYIFGGADNDTIYWGGGDAKIFGDGGDDTVIVGRRTDGASIHGGRNNDTLDFSDVAGVAYGESTSHVQLTLDDGFAEVHSNQTSDVATFDQDGFENVIGSIGDDRINGDNQENILTGHYGEDVIYGDGGNDTLIGGQFRDGIGDGVRDDFVFRFGDGKDTISDFELGIDKIVFSQSEVKGFDELTLVDNGNAMTVWYGKDQDQIYLEGVGTAINAGDFLFT